MILTNLFTKNEYQQYPEAIMKAIEWLKKNQNEILTMNPGEYPIEDKAIFAKVFDVTTKTVAETSPEIHKKYIDVQYWASGEEYMGYAPLTENFVVKQADESEDLYFLEKAENETFIPAKKDDIIVLFPEDIHRPAIQINGAKECRKVVVKVSVELLK